MSLAEQGDGLVLADGSIVLPNGKVVKPKRQMVEVPSHSQAQAIVTNARRRLADLPAVPKTMNAISVVLTYSLFGLDDTDIAIATGLNVTQVTRMRISDAYVAMRETLVKQLLADDGDSVRSIIAQKAVMAANKIAELVEEGDDAIALSASKDILDRAGHRPIDVVEARVKMEGGLTIEIRKKDSANDSPVIDITPED